MYVALGNHDCYSDINNEIAYSKVNPQWMFSTDYYDMVIPLADDPSLNLVNLVLNGCSLSCLKLDSNFNADECKSTHQQIDGPDALAQKSWLEEMLKKYSKDPSTRWLAVTVHHPFTIEPALKKHILPLL